MIAMQYIVMYDLQVIKSVSKNVNPRDPIVSENDNKNENLRTLGTIWWQNQLGSYIDFIYNSNDNIQVPQLYLLYFCLITCGAYFNQFYGKENGETKFALISKIFFAPNSKICIGERGVLTVKTV